VWKDAGSTGNASKIGAGEDDGQARRLLGAGGVERRVELDLEHLAAEIELGAPFVDNRMDSGL